MRDVVVEVETSPESSFEDVDHNSPPDSLPNSLPQSPTIETPRTPPPSTANMLDIPLFSNAKMGSTSTLSADPRLMGGSTTDLSTNQNSPKNLSANQNSAKDLPTNHTQGQIHSTSRQTLTSLTPKHSPVMPKRSPKITQRSPLEDLAHLSTTSDSLKEGPISNGLKQSPLEDLASLHGSSQSLNKNQKSSPAQIHVQPPSSPHASTSKPAPSSSHSQSSAPNSHLPSSAPNSTHSLSSAPSSKTPQISSQSSSTMSCSPTTIDREVDFDLYDNVFVQKL